MAVKSVRSQVRESLMEQLRARHGSEAPRYLREQVAVYMSAYDRMLRLGKAMDDMEPGSKAYLEASKEWRQLSAQQLQILDKLGLSRPDQAAAMVTL